MLKAFRHTCLYVGHARMLVNGCYMHYGYVYVCNCIVFMVTYMIYASFSVWSYAHASDSQE